MLPYDGHGCRASKAAMRSNFRETPQHVSSACRRALETDEQGAPVRSPCYGAVADPLRPTEWSQVSDFGLSMLMKPGQEQALAAQHGTLAYMPPELISDDALSFATDVYSFGILLWEMFSAKVGR